MVVLGQRVEGSAYAALMPKWDIFAGRVTLFPVVAPATSLPSPAAVFTQIWGNDPDQYQKAANALSPSMAQGKIGSIAVTCLFHPARMDLNLAAIQRPDMAGQLALVDQPREMHAELVRVIHELGNGTIGIEMTRVAIFLHVVTLVTSNKQANDILQRTIPAQYGLKLSDEEDFIFQINRPYSSKVASGIDMNSLVKWSLERFQVVLMSIPTSVSSIASGVNPAQDSKEFMTASVAFDINNKPRETRLPTNQQAALLTEGLEAISDAQRRMGLAIEGW